MRLTINGDVHQIDAKYLSDVLILLEFEGKWLATAVNGELIHRNERQHCQLDNGDRIEILAPMQGG
jgi:sulfur carrier protein